MGSQISYDDVPTLKPFVQRTTDYIRRIDGATNTLLSRFSDILQLATTPANDKISAATESFQIESHATSMIRAAEDLLSIARSLKETWILGNTVISVDELHAVENGDEIMGKAAQILQNGQ